LGREDKEGITLEQAIIDAGGDPSVISEGRAILDPSTIHSFHELHIAQSSILDGHDVGIGTSVRGPIRVKMKIYGEYDHSGASTQEERQDAVETFARIHTAFCDYMKNLSDEADIVWTAPIVHTDSKINSINAVPGYLEASYDIRSVDSAILDQAYLQLQNISSEISNTHRTSVKFEVLSNGPPVPSLDKRLRTLSKENADKLGLDAVYMVSGASHDSVNFHVEGKPIKLIFIPSKGGSHNPNETSTPLNLYNGTILMGADIYTLAKQ
jgi:acetylornithine deacetylase/succinyl-diaminopimelate desuccinylase-like protein